MSGNRYSHDRSGTIVTAAMLLLALLGVITVFHEPIAALVSPETSAREAPPPLPGDDRSTPAPPTSATR